MLASAIRVPGASVTRKLDLIEAPNNLGLRPPGPGIEPGTWRGPSALERAGLSRRLRPDRHERLARPRYTTDAQPGTRIRNGVALRAFSLELAAEVARSLERGALPIVIGGDCSNLLGCVLALRRKGGRGLVHVDGHSDFFHPGNYDAASRLGSAAGMDLALATGRGEALLTAWPSVEGPLVADADAVQIGEREASDPAFYRDIETTPIERTTVQALQAEGVAAALERTLRHLGRRKIVRAWLHVDLDVLDQAVMPAVDSPGSPGLTYAELAALIAGLMRSGRIAGVDFAIYDPDLDPDGRCAREIVACIGDSLEIPA
jgi:arginase